MKVVSLFCGIGGFDKGFDDAGFQIIWANDIDKYAVQTYRANWENEIVCDDIHNIPINEIPDFDVLVGGFPCQPFSLMGVKKGFDDTRGTVFFHIAKIIKEKSKQGKKPKAIILENVRNLYTHDNGKTFAKIKLVLEEKLNYKVFSDIINTSDYGIPQTRNRTYIVCFSNQNAEFTWPSKIDLKITLQDLLEDNVEGKYYLSDRIIPTILSNGSGKYRGRSEIDLKIARPLCATMAKMHRACQDNYVTQDGRIRRLTPRECARLQGFSDDFIIPVSNTQAYKQFGNAVTINVTNAIAKQVRNTLEKLKEW
jgi:DNA (cytosine-5)-methyltransferase 1